jgi:NADPH:quinone reductase-like Zn-dependent oxidoreductase
MSSQESYSTNLPVVIFQATKAIQSLDPAKFIACFAPDAVLVDEAKRHTTLTAIQAWFEKGPCDHKASINILETGSESDKSWIHVMMDGDFEADYGIKEPFPLYLHFYTSEDGKKIKMLRINQISPDTPTMRSVWAASGNPENPFSSLRNDVMPRPTIPDGQVLVKVAAVGLNYHDIFTLRGLGMFPLTFPLILGNEGAGTLDDGTEVIIFPVMGNPTFGGDGTLDPSRHVLGELTQGSLAEYVVVPERNVVRKPKGMAWESAGVLGIAWLTAWRMLVTRSGLKGGETILVQGSTGGVATALIQLGTAMGYTVWVTGRTKDKRAFAEKLGAHRTFASGEALPEKVAAVFDMSGEQTFKHSMESVRTGGTLVCCGLHSGGMFAEVDLMKLFTQGINIHGSYAGNKEEFESLVKFVSEKDIVPYVGEVLPLERTEEGLKMIMESRVTGKVVVKL